MGLAPARFGCLRCAALQLPIAVLAGFAGGCSDARNPYSDQMSDPSGPIEYKSGGAGSCSNTLRPTNDAYCGAACNPAPECRATASRPVEACCVLLGEPGHDRTNKLISLTTDTTEYAAPAGTQPDVSCFDAAPARGTPAPTTLSGVVKAFASGCDLVDVKLEIYTVKRTGDPATDGDIDQLIGTPVVTTKVSPSQNEPVEKCSNGRTNREYSYPNVPTNTELVILTSGATQGSWARLYTYNVYLSETDPEFQDGSYRRDVVALAVDDFNTIPTVAIGTTINPGNGAIGGEIHDCQNYRVRKALVDVSVPRKGLEYFDDSETDPLPLRTRNDTGTGRTALYMALDIKPGPVRVSAVGLTDRGTGPELVSLGYHDVRVYPNAVTSLTLRGRRPFQ